MPAKPVSHGWCQVLPPARAVSGSTWTMTVTAQVPGWLSMVKPILGKQFPRGSCESRAPKYSLFKAAIRMGLYFYTIESLMDGVQLISEMPSSYISYCPSIKYLAFFFNGTNLFSNHIYLPQLYIGLFSGQTGNFPNLSVLLLAQDSHCESG